MKYLITAKVIYGLPFVVEADNADAALGEVTMGRGTPGDPVMLTTLPTAQWSVEPLENSTALVEMYAALQGVTRLFHEITGLDYTDERVAIVFRALASAQETIERTNKILEELNDRVTGSAMPSQDS
jgi:hypothetical protein